jgi:hypothetical protein
MLLAVAVALLPIPVAVFQLLPAYRVHAQFLAFYAPLFCLLLLAYLLYIRDSLARLMFADVLDPLPEYQRYYRQSAGDAMRRSLNTVQRVLLALLPAALLLTSLYCVVRYTRRLNDSVDLAGREMAVRAAKGEVGLAPVAAEPARTRPGVRPAKRHQTVPSAPSLPTDSAPTLDPPGAPARQFVLRHAGVDEIPFLFELTVLYIGAFAAALVALILMALKEYATDALGLTEQDLVLRRSQGQDWPAP